MNTNLRTIFVLSFRSNNGKHCILYRDVALSVSLSSFKLLCHKAYTKKPYLCVKVFLCKPCDTVIYG